MKIHCKKLIALIAVAGLVPFAQSSTLEEIYQQALLNDHTYKAAQANLDAGRESVNLGRADLLPKVNAQASWENSTNEQTQTNGMPPIASESESDSTQSGYTISLSQSLFNMAVWYNFKQSKAAGNIAEAQFGIAEQSLIVRSAEAYFEALQAVDNLETSKAEENALSHQLEQTRQRFEVGLTAITEVHEAQAVFDSAMAERLIAEGRLGIAFEALEVITGRPHYQLAPLKKELPVTPPTPADRQAWVDMALDSNFSLQIASLNADVAKQKAKIQKAGHYPTVTGNISLSDYNTTGDRNTVDFEDDNQGNSIGITVSVPLFNGGAVSASRRKAANEFIAAREQLNQKQRDIVQSTRSFHLTVTTSVTTVKARSQAITSNQSALEATQAGYDVGTRDLVDVLNAQRNLYRAQRNYYDSLYAYVLSTLQLKQVAGTLSANDLTELNNWLDANRTVSRSI
ncbi:TolC family outer membrane protein [Teredinibacter purpureus]|jgi:type I secretion outer membrane protein, TolC family|uniref:TolC family outer membrane protein n=1 Tax=Teredinibacter purpureus TaxID=2731756 RepID=UPI0005F787D1|nr:TolC family outer membrane protein [Teredinibacter purpureus]